MRQSSEYPQPIKIFAGSCKEGCLGGCGWERVCVRERERERDRERRDCRSWWRKSLPITRNESRLSTHIEDMEYRPARLGRQCIKKLSYSPPQNATAYSCFTSCRTWLLALEDQTEEAAVTVGIRVHHSGRSRVVSGTQTSRTWTPPSPHQLLSTLVMLKQLKIEFIWVRSKSEASHRILP